VKLADVDELVLLLKFADGYNHALLFFFQWGHLLLHRPIGLPYTLVFIQHCLNTLLTQIQLTSQSLAERPQCVKLRILFLDVGITLTMVIFKLGIYILELSVEGDQLLGLVTYNFIETLTLQRKRHLALLQSILMHPAFLRHLLFIHLPGPVYFLLYLLYLLERIGLVIRI
jgi:hypothetical protein